MRGCVWNQPSVFITFEINLIMKGKIMQNILKQNGINSLVFNAKSINYSVEVAVETIPTCSLIHLLQYGTRKINDQFNSGKETNGATPEYFDS